MKFQKLFGHERSKNRKKKTGRMEPTPMQSLLGLLQEKKVNVQQSIRGFAMNNLYFDCSLTSDKVVIVSFLNYFMITSGETHLVINACDTVQSAFDTIMTYLKGEHVTLTERFYVVKERVRKQHTEKVFTLMFGNDK